MGRVNEPDDHTQPYSAQTRWPPPSDFSSLFILAYQSLRVVAIAATRKLHPAHTKLPVGNPLLRSLFFHIHCAMICPIPAQELFTAIARGRVRKLGELQVTQFVKDGAAFQPGSAVDVTYAVCDSASKCAS